MAYEIPKDGLIHSTDGKSRCFWAGDHADYIDYHDNEWGVPVTGVPVTGVPVTGVPVVDDYRLFEKIVLEGFQSGLSWLTILRKRENFRSAFAGFDFEKVARFNENDVERLLEDAGIVRHRRKIESAINNAKRAVDLREEFGSLYEFFIQYRPELPERDPLRRPTIDELLSMSKTAASTRLARDLKKRGWSFVGPTTAYAFMQAMGMVNDHIEGCDFG